MIYIFFWLAQFHIYLCIVWLTIICWYCSARHFQSDGVLTLVNTLIEVHWVGKSPRCIVAPVQRHGWFDIYKSIELAKVHVESRQPPCSVTVDLCIYEYWRLTFCEKWVSLLSNIDVQLAVSMENFKALVRVHPIA